MILINIIINLASAKYDGIKSGDKLLHSSIICTMVLFKHNGIFIFSFEWNFRREIHWSVRYMEALLTLYLAFFSISIRFIRRQIHMHVATSLWWLIRMIGKRDKNSQKIFLRLELSFLEISPKLEDSRRFILPVLFSKTVN